MARDVKIVIVPSSWMIYEVESELVAPGGQLPPQIVLEGLVYVGKAKRIGNLGQMEYPLIDGSEEEKKGPWFEESDD